MADDRHPLTAALKMGFRKVRHFAEKALRPSRISLQTGRHGTEADTAKPVAQRAQITVSAPLLCAGITTWSSLRHWKVGNGANLAVIGLGGLGHMALKLGRRSARTSSWSRGRRAREHDARRLGADSIVLSTDSAQMAAVSGKFDLIIDTVPSVI
jgi:D-arabinose 1-dehydrogenase-like Zn-dependent alcohol dehydrogenase